jgi:hypothetical protein
MRIGSKVAVGFYNEDGEAVPPMHAQAGTIIAINTRCNGDGYEDADAVTVRWGNGLVETVDLSGDEGGGWEIVDITPSLYANLYLHDRAYGGPEEGGWWYDTYSPVDGDWINNPPRFGHFETTCQAKEAFRELQVWCDEENLTRRSPSSVASEGHFVVRLEAWPPEPYPSRRPHYC